MSERPDLPKIKPKRAPSFFNHEATYGAWIGSCIGGLVGLAATYSFKGNWKLQNKIEDIAELAGSATGFCFGALQGKQRQEREQREGKIVSDPSYVNSGLWAGCLLALIVPFSAIESWPMFLGGTAVAMAAGSLIGKQRMQQDFDQAIAERDAKPREKAKMQEPSVPLYKNTVTHEEQLDHHQPSAKQHAHDLHVAREQVEQAGQVRG